MKCPLLLITLFWALIASSAGYLRYPQIYRTANGRIITPSEIALDASSIQFVEDAPLMLESTSSKVFQLGFDLIKELKSEDGNVILSPTSITSCLDLLLFGAEGQTKKELSRVLGGPFLMHSSTWDGISLGSLMSKLQTKSEISTGSAIFVQDGVTVEPEFIKNSMTAYQAPIVNLNFKNSITSVDSINKWVAQQTHGKIKNIIREPLSPDTKAVVINALYFKGDWEYPFLDQGTKLGKFHISDDKVFDIPLMMLDATLEHYKNRDFKMIGLPYKGKDMTMYIILPEASGINGVEAVQSQLSSSRIEDILKLTKMGEVTAIIPKFKVSMRWSLKDALQARGLGSIFDPARAEFGKFIKTNGSESFYTSDIIHAVDIELTERGTTAAASTAAIFTKSFKFFFKANRPFLFFIRHRESGLVPFMGTIVNPVLR